MGKTQYGQIFTNFTTISIRAKSHQNDQQIVFGLINVKTLRIKFLRIIIFLLFLFLYISLSGPFDTGS